MCRVKQIVGNAMLTLILGEGGGEWGLGMRRKSFGTFNSREFRRGLLASVYDRSFLSTHNYEGPMRGQKILTLVLQSPTKKHIPLIL
jgi:hypothetical protein